jgi:type VI secretion system secreted protein Hcp
MKSARKSFGYVIPVVAIVGLFIFASRMGGPSHAVSAPLAAAAASQIKMYLRVDGVQGELTDDLHKGCMEVQAYEHQPHIWGDPHVTEGGKADDLRACRLTVSRPVNKATPALLLQYCKQTPIPTVTLELWREGGAAAQKMMVYTHHDVALNAIRNMKGLAADDLPAEELTFVCSAMEWAYTEYDANGKPKGEISTQYTPGTGR